MAEVQVTAIYNRCGETVRIARQDGTYEIKNGDPADGPFTFKYDPEKEGHIPTPDTAWYANSLMEFTCSRRSGSRGGAERVGRAIAAVVALGL